MKTDKQVVVPEASFRPSVPLFSLVLATVVISVAFIEVTAPFLEALSLAAIFAVLAQPSYRFILERVGGKKGVASATTVLIGTIGILSPLIGVAYLAASQAAGLQNETGALFETLSTDVESLKVGTYEFPEWMPFRDQLSASGPQVVHKAQELMGTIATFLASSLSGVTNGTASFFLSLFAFVYALFFFLPLETSAFQPILQYSGLSKNVQDQLHDRIISVSRATIKGTLLIGIIQGALGGVGFWMASLPGAIFWAAVMTIAAAIPGVGAAGVVFGGAIYLAFQGALPEAFGLALWAMLVVGTADNLLRPALVGQDAQMSDLMIFVSTLGGLSVFGASGLIFGPVIAGMFITVWQAVSTSTSQADPEEALSQEKYEEDTTVAPGDTERHTSHQLFPTLTASKEEFDAEFENLKRDLDESRTK